MIPEFVLPLNFHPDRFLTGKLMLRCDDARWFVNTILRKTAAKDIDVLGFVRLRGEYLRKVMDKHSCTAVIRALVQGGVIETKAYRIGKKPMGYRITAQHTSELCKRVRAVDPRLIERIERCRQQMEQKTADRWKPIHSELAEVQNCITMTDDADTMLDTLLPESRLCQSVLVSNLRRRSYTFSVSSTGRFFNGITGLKRELREALRFGGERVGSVDIVNAQPALLAMMLTHLHPSNGYKPWDSLSIHSDCSLPPPFLPLVSIWSERPERDLICFSQSAVNGSLYEMVAADSGLTREITKLRFLVDVLAKKGRYPSKVEQSFKRLFPSVYRIIRNVNRDDHSTLIRLLQRAESWLVVEQVAPRLISSGTTAMTLHDAIFAPQHQLGEVEAAFHAVLDELGFSMSLKCEGTQ